MFKKTLVATSLLALASTSMADTLGSSATVPTTVITSAAPTIQAIATADDVSVVAQILHLDSNLSVGDTIAVTYIGAALDEGYSHPSTPLVISQSNDNGGDPACTVASQNISFAGLSGSVATYRVQATNGVTEHCAVALPALEIDGASLATADKFSISTTTSTPYGVIQSVAATKLVDVAAAELTSVVTTDFDEVVAVASARNALGAGTDVATFTLADSGGGATVAASTMTVTGDFSWAAQTTAGVTTYPGVVVTGGQVSGAVYTATSATWAMSGVGVATLTLTPPTALVTGAAYPQIGVTTLSPTTFVFSSTINYTNEESVAVAGGDSITAGVAGAWTMDGASITAFGIPKSTSVTPFLWVQNKGTLAGDITVDVRCDGVTTSAIAAGTSAAKSNTSIGAAVKTAMDAVATCGAGSRYDADITVNATQANVEVLAGYKVTAADGSNDRLQLETSISLN